MGGEKMKMKELKILSRFNNKDDVSLISQDWIFLTKVYP